jgi:ribokinase
MGIVLVVGSSNTDLVGRAPRLPVAGETLRGSSFATYPGGKGANQAVAAARAGASVRFVGAIGSDDFGTQRRAELAAEGIDVTGVRVVAGAASGVALIIVAESGDNQIILVPGANDTVTPEIARDAVAAGRFDVLSLTLEIPLESVAAAVAGNEGRGLVVLNCAPFDARVLALLPDVHLLVGNEIEAGQLLGREVRPEDARDAVLALLELGSCASVITLGQHGAVLADETGVVTVAAPQVPVRDTTGAGDAFCGAVAAWLAAGGSLRESVAAGVVAGAIAVTRDGAQPSLPYRQEIEALLQAQARS